MIGTKNAPNIVSISYDSKVCQWNDGELNNPRLSFNLFPQNQQQPSTGDQSINMYINSLQFAEDETDKFYVGCDDNCIYQANMHSANSREMPQWRKFAGHEAPITKIALHPGKSMSESKANAGILSDMSELMLSASMDWKIKLWYPREAFKDTEVYTFESS